MAGRVRRHRARREVFEHQPRVAEGAEVGLVGEEDRHEGLGAALLAEHVLDRAPLLLAALAEEREDDVRHRPVGRLGIGRQAGGGSEHRQVGPPLGPG